MKNPKKPTPKSPKTPSTNPRKPQQQPPQPSPSAAQDILLQTLLSPTTSTLMQGFSWSQKKIISQEFGKMMRALRKKLASPDKGDASQRSKLEMKTQRFQYSDYGASWESLKKTMVTQRKLAHKRNSKANPASSPKKQTRNNSSEFDPQPRNSSITSPKKTRKQPNPTATHSQTKPKSQKSSRKRTQANQRHGGENYVLVGDRFVWMDEEDVFGLREEIRMGEEEQKEGEKEVEEIWKEFLEEKKKIHSRTQSYQQQEEKKKEDVIEVEQGNLVSIASSHSSIVDRVLGTTTPTNLEPSPDTNQLFLQEFYQQGIQNQSPRQGRQAEDIRIVLNNRFVKSPIRMERAGLQNESPSHSQSFSCQSQYIQPSPTPSPIPTPNPQYIQPSPTPSPIPTPNPDPLSPRISAINLHFQTQKQTLHTLLTTQKISQQCYQQHMDKIIQLYDREMTEVARLRDLLDLNQAKIEMMVRRSSQGVRGDLDGDVEGLLRRVVEGCGGEEQGLGEGKENEDSIKGHAYDTHFDSSQTKQQPIMPIKHKMDERLAQQLGLLPSPSLQPPQFPTSVLQIYSFIKSFYIFLIKHHLQEFLLYVNMPYGYSVEQRLRYMQGYDDDEDEEGQGQGERARKGGIVYGIEEVIRPALLDEFYRVGGQVGDLEKLHNRVVFDAINEAINKFRPYYAINGCPYQWTTTEKALTYYFIREDCLQELLEKVQVQVLKWSSTLCGLLLNPISQPQPQPQTHPLSIEQIFQKYTQQTPSQLLEQRQQKILKSEKLEVEQTNFEWSFHDEFKTALLYQVASCVLEDLAHQCAMKMGFGFGAGEVYLWGIGGGDGEEEFL